MLATRLDQWEADVMQKGKQAGLQEGLHKGLQEGLHKGQRLFLLRLLENRFGPLPPWALTQINAADDTGLERWGLNVIEAKNLDEVFR